MEVTMKLVALYGDPFAAFAKQKTESDCSVKFHKQHRNARKAKAAQKGTPKGINLK